ncbi:hypothetical protein LTR08_007497 [Meristemomyces frigidus]|nr:hypothetical protein LTR08_007497 [Meristemomyces frigidus]
MAPIHEYAAGTVTLAQVRSYDEESILVEAGGFSPMRWFLEHAADNCVQQDVERPRKRRKVKSGDTLDGRQAVPSSDEEIPLYKVTIDLHFPEALGSRPVGELAMKDDVEFQDAEDIPVMPYGIRKEEGVSKLCLTTPGQQSAVLMVDVDRLPGSVREALRHVALPGRLKEAYENRRDQTNPATSLRCVLKRRCRPKRFDGQMYRVVRLEASISWRSGVSAFPAGMPMGKARVYEDYEYLTEVYEDQARATVDHSQPWAPRDFYDSVHVPDKNMDTSSQFEGILETELYPFQKRAINWMLSREGVRHGDGQLMRIPNAELQRDQLSFYEPVTDVHGRVCYVNYLQGVVSREKPAGNDAQLSGGLLAEEMGLGKTVELMALVALHSRPELGPGKVRDISSNTTITPSKATLIITPSSILQQWKSELSRHAPALKVFQYNGVPGGGDKKAKAEAEIIQDLTNKYDVVLATYQTLGREVHFAEDPPDRNMRHVRKFARARSPLIQIQWWRICLDEAQMVESGVTAAARVACRLPRVHSWAVSGTPLRKNVQDLHGLLIFLRYQTLSDNPKLWTHLITNHRHIFRRIFGEIALRHTKARVREELSLPAQKRVVLTVPFSAVEQQQYSTLFTEMCEELGLNSDGSPLRDDWDPQAPAVAEAMRTWLVRLRQTCLHPQVGGRNRKALGKGQGPLRTVAEVLEVMIEQNETLIRTEERAVLNAKVARAHVIGNNGEDNNRSEKALAIYEDAMQTSATMVGEARERLAEAEATPAEKHQGATETEDEGPSSESTVVLGRLRTHLRTALQLQHVCTFFAATAYYQMKINEADVAHDDSARFKEYEGKETSLYEIAKQLRKEILSESSRKAEGLMRKIQDLARSGKLTHMPGIKDLKMIGIESRRIVEKSDELFDVIREQGRVLGQWRAKMAEYLLKPFVDEDEGVETTGDEYEDSTKQQDELYVYFDAVKAVQADLNTFITGEDAPLIDHEAKMLCRDANWSLDDSIEFDGVVHAPELLLKLFAKRAEFRSRKGEVGSVRGLIQEARILENSMNLGVGARSEVERSLVHDILQALQKVFSDYMKTMSGLEKEVDLFRSAQNQRLDFYRQLQELSDAVAPYKEELDASLDAETLEEAVEHEDKVSRSLAQLKTKNRFLLHLRDESGTQSGPRICVICQCSFENGVLTVCGHQYCKECIQHWWSQHRTCPVCKRKLTLEDFHNITYKPKEFKAQEEVHSSPSSPGSQTSSAASPAQHASLYSDVDPKLMDEIKSIDLPASYGTKIDTLGRHLRWIREHDPGAKSIVFSQFREFLDVLGAALSEFNIGHSRLGRAGAVERFRHDVRVDCLLLDAKTDSSGLTLVNATHVFVCEPLVQTAVELQAIARVHRIGQTRATTVWMYLIGGTVEEAVYEVSVVRRLAHVQAQAQQQRSSRRGKAREGTPGPLREQAVEAAESEVMQAAPVSKLLVAGKGGGELVGNEDLWQCLFGKTRGVAAKASVELEAEVGRHLRVEAGVQRQADVMDVTAEGMPGARTPAEHLAAAHRTKLAASYQALLTDFASPDLATVGNYTLGRLIGKGSFGKVYLATHQLTNGSRVVLKSARKDDANLAREIHHHRQFVHPHIARLYEVIVTETLVWLALEYCPGDELYTYLLQRGRMEPAQVQKIFTQLVGAVRYVHAKGCVHRDLKLENILLDKHDDVKLCDFGFTREYAGSTSYLQTWCGTVCYSAPEMLRGEKYAGEKVDVWSLGVILYALLCGELPYDEDDDAATKARILKEDPAYPEHIPEPAKELIKRLLSKRPLLRPSLADILKDPWLAEYAPQQQEILKLQQPAAFTTPVEIATLERMRSAGVNIDTIIEHVLSQRCDALAGWWALLIEKEQRKEKRRERKRREREAEAKSLRRLSAASSRLLAQSALLGEIHEGEEGDALGGSPRSRGRRMTRPLNGAGGSLSVHHHHQSSADPLPRVTESKSPTPKRGNGNENGTLSPTIPAPRRPSTSRSRSRPPPPPKDAAAPTIRRPRELSRGNSGGSMLRYSTVNPDLLSPTYVPAPQRKRRTFYQQPLKEQLAWVKHWFKEGAKRARSPTSQGEGSAKTSRLGSSGKSSPHPQALADGVSSQPDELGMEGRVLGMLQRTSTSPLLGQQRVAVPAFIRPELQSRATLPARPRINTASSSGSVTSATKRQHRTSLSPSHTLTPHSSYHRRPSGGLRGRKSTSSSVSSVRSAYHSVGGGGGGGGGGGHQHTHSKTSSTSSASLVSPSGLSSASGRATGARSPHGSAVKILPGTPTGGGSGSLPSGIRVSRRPPPGGLGTLPTFSMDGLAVGRGQGFAFGGLAVAPGSPGVPVFARRKRSVFKGPTGGAGGSPAGFGRTGGGRGREGSVPAGRRSGDVGAGITGITEEEEDGEEGEEDGDGEMEEGEEEGEEVEVDAFGPALGLPGPTGAGAELGGAEVGGGEGAYSPLSLSPLPAGGAYSPLSLLPAGEAVEVAGLAKAVEAVEGPSVPLTAEALAKMEAEEAARGAEGVRGVSL